MEETAVKSDNQNSNHGFNVRRWREWRNINQDVLAELIGVSQATLSLYEKKSKLEPEVLQKLGKALDIPIEAITELEQGTAINIFSGTWNDNASNSVNYNPTFNPIDKVVELYDDKIALYERMLKEKDEAISLLHDVLKDKK